MSDTPESPDVTVVCAWYNRAEYLPVTLDSLLAQTHPNYDIVLVNDGSPDPRVREILDGYSDPRLTIIHQANTGFTRAIRTAIDTARGRYLAIQGAGDISFSNRLLRQAAFLDREPDFAAVGCLYNNALIATDGTGPPLPSDHPGFDGTGPNSGRLEREVTPKMIMTRNPFTHGEVMIRRRAYDDVGGYRPFFANSQDKDLWLRLHDHGHRLGVLADWLYQRHTFATDGIATSLKKLAIQLAYSRVGDRCHQQRRAGLPEDVAVYGPLALMRVPKGPATTRGLLRGVKQAAYYGTLDRSELLAIRDLYGPVNHALAWLLCRYLAARR